MRHDIVRRPQPAGIEPPSSDRVPRRAIGDPIRTPDGAPLDLAQVSTALRRRWWIVALAVLASAGLAAYWVRSQPQRFTSRAVVRLVDNRQALVGGLGGEARNGPDVAVMSQAEILHSRAVATEAVNAEPLGVRVRTTGFPIAAVMVAEVTDTTAAGDFDVEFTSGGWRLDRAGAPLVPFDSVHDLGPMRLAITRVPAEVTEGVVHLLPQDQAVDVALGLMSATPRRLTTLLDVEFTAGDPAVAVRMVNAFVHAYRDVDGRLSLQQVRRRLDFIRSQLTETDARLAAAERAVSEFRMRQRAYTSADKFASQQTELARLDVQWQELDAERRLVTGLLARLEGEDAEARATALGMLASSPAGATPVISRAYGQLVSYEASRDELTVGPQGRPQGSAAVLRLDTLISTARQQLLGAVRSHVALLDARIESVDELRRGGRTALQGVPAAEAEETRLSQNAEVLRDQAAMLRAELQQTRIREAAEIGRVEIVDLATRASLAEVNGMQVVAFALLLGLMLGGGVAVLLEHLDRTVKGRQTIEDSFGLPLLATVPRLEVPVTTGGRFARAMRRRMPITAYPRPAALVSASDPRAPGAEAFRQLRTNLLYLRSGSPLRSIMVTSAGPGDGKTSVAVNLATTLVQQGMQVLVIDFDLVRPRVHRLLGVPMGPGVQQVLAEQIPPDSAIHATKLQGLFVMTAGTPVAESVDVAGSPRFRAMLRDLAMDFDIIIVDSPPVLAVADSIALSGAADGVLVVSRVGATKVEALAEALRHLDAVGARIIGAVLNDPDDRARQYGGYHFSYSYANRATVGA